MRFRNGLALFSRTNSKGCWNIASFHSPHSLTWRWILTFRRFAPGEFRVWPIGTAYRDNNGLQWWVRLPFVGYLQWQQQRPMWFRDLWQRLRDERDGLIKPEPDDTPPPDRSPFVPTVIDGGQSIH